jgi:hypothetical protein
MTGHPEVENPEVGLEDDPAGPPRTTMTLLASLVARVRTLGLLNGAQAVGSMVAGVAALGRHVGSTDQGARLRAALEASRLGTNGAALWAALSLDTSSSALPPRPVYEDLRNDVALLAAPDLMDALERLSESDLQEGIGLVAEPEEVMFIDFIVGLWFMASEIVDLIDAMSGTRLERPGSVAGSDGPDRGGSVLR